MKSKQISTLILAVFFGLLWLNASNAYAQPEAEIESISIDFSVFSYRRPDDIKYFTDAETSKEISFYSGARSPEYAYEGAPVITFFKEFEVDPVFDPKENGNPENLEPLIERIPVGQAIIPEGVKNALLVFFPSRSRDAGKAGKYYNIFVIDDSSSALRESQMLVLNASGINLVSKVDAESFVAGPGLHGPFRLSGLTKIQMATRVRDELIQAFLGEVELDAGERAILILYPPKLRGSVEVQARLLVDTDDTYEPPPSDANEDD